MFRANSVESSTGSPPPPLEMPGFRNNNEANMSSTVHICPLCSRAFSSTQALGGHQNAHRKERSDELANYIRQRLDLNTKCGFNGSDLLSGDHNKDCSSLEANKTGFEAREPSWKRTKSGVDGGDVAETVSLELTLAVGGCRATGENAYMSYNYPDVLFPALEFMDTSVDLDLKL